MHGASGRRADHVDQAQDEPGDGGDDQRIEWACFFATAVVDERLIAPLERVLKEATHTIRAVLERDLAPA